MAKRYNLTFKFFDTREQAKAFCDKENANGTAYKRHNKKAHFTEWSNEKKTGHKFVVWYYYY